MKWLKNYIINWENPVQKRLSDIEVINGFNLGKIGLAVPLFSAEDLVQRLDQQKKRPHNQETSRVFMASLLPPIQVFLLFYLKITFFSLF